MLPPGVKTLIVIRRQRDPVTRVHEAKRLLEYLLGTVTEGVRGPDGGEAGVGDRVRAVEGRFSDVRDVMWALGVRNRLEHPSHQDAGPSRAEIERAAGHLVRAIEEIAPHVGREFARAAGYRGRMARESRREDGKPGKSLARVGLLRRIRGVLGR